MRVCHIFNMANNGYAIVKALRERGFDADIILNSTDFGMGLPMWEELNIKEDPYKFGLRKVLDDGYKLPEWMKIWWVDSLHVNPMSLLDLFALVKKGKYDILHLHPPSPIYYQFMRKPFIIHEAGWIRKLATLDTPSEKLGRRAYARADCVLMTNPDTYSLLQGMKYRREKFIPFCIDTEKYKPMPVKRDSKSPKIFFHPTRQSWEWKANYLLIIAFTQFIKKYGGVAKLRMVDWGWSEDVARMKAWIRTSGMEKHVEWIAPVTKPELIRLYNECDGVFDQFLLGSGGTTLYEGMSCGKPVVIFLNKWNERCFGEMPPVLNVRKGAEYSRLSTRSSYEAIEDIVDAMKRVAFDHYISELGEKARKFVQKYCHPDVVSKQMIALYEEVMRR